MKTVQVNDKTKHILIRDNDWNKIWAEVSDTQRGVEITLHSQGSITNKDSHETMFVTLDELKSLVEAV